MDKTIKRIFSSSAVLFSSFCATFNHPACAQSYSLPNHYQQQKAQFLAQGQGLYDLLPWSVLFYYGYTVTDPLGHIIKFRHLERWPENIQSLEFAYTLDKSNGLREFFSPLVGVVQIAGVLTRRHDAAQGTIYEIDPYIAFRWANFPWNEYVVTSLAIGEGISYTTSVPAVEKKDNDHTKRLLNYLMFEATFALPDYPHWQVVARIHHRSGAYGLYRAGNSGSNDLGLGIRYLFE